MARTEEEREVARRLRSQHPLYTKLSGAVLWELFLELGYAEEECGDLLDAHVDVMFDVVSVMRSLESDEAVGYVYTSEHAEQLCEACANLLGKKMITRTFTALPPFGVGCALRCKALAKDDPTIPQADISKGPYCFCCDRFGKEQDEI